MIKQYMKGQFISFDEKEILFQTPEKQYSFNKDNIEIEDFDIIKNKLYIDVVIKANSQWFIKEINLKIIEVYDLIDFEIYMFDLFFENYNYFFYKNSRQFERIKKDNDNTMYSKSYFINEYKQTNKQEKNIFDWFFRTYSFYENSFSKIIKFFFNNNLDFELLKEFFEIKTINSLDNFLDIFVNNIFKYMNCDKDFTSINKFYSSIFDCVNSLNLDIYSFELQTLYFLLNIFKECDEDGSSYINLSKYKCICNDNNIIENIDDITDYCEQQKYLKFKDMKVYPWMYYMYEYKLATKIKKLWIMNYLVTFPTNV
ncbi:hypothetical protein SGLAD_v1c06490 [Spiroplasma gladiatoris]|uniref:Uncharacterized protein n=1 Tax=Spiroplasma gladiatoris TaxID=2143 RepID=A0A4P7AJ82_9MOLU|nr:hypothetical protein [Spiroplasma gladiatoris]QBQ07848.1 hypothetical protein SGLAD_v1c06490 [Spiroplasma gladiatoris]